MPVTQPLIEVDEIIPLVYQGPLETKPWQRFLRCLRERANCDTAILWLRPADPHVLSIHLWESRRSISEQYGRRAAKVHASFPTPTPLRKVLQNSGDLYCLDEVISRDELHATDYYQKLAKPYGVEYEVGMCVMGPDNWQCHIGMLNGPGTANFDESDKALLLGILPHLEAALAIYAQLACNELEKTAYGETLERLTIGTIILDGKGKLMEMNKAAQNLIENKNIASLSGDKFVLRTEASNARLQGSIKSALQWQQSGNRETYVDVLQVPSSSGETIGILVRTVPVSRYRYPSQISPNVIIYITGMEQHTLAPHELVAELFGLTRSEARLAILLADGFSLSEAADKLGLTESTVRTYMKNIFSKTGVSRQPQLVRLLLKSVALLG